MGQRLRLKGSFDFVAGVLGSSWCVCFDLNFSSFYYHIPGGFQLNVNNGVVYA